MPSQIVDRTKGIRPSTFFEGGVVAHASFADPFDVSLAELIAKVSKEHLPDLKLHTDKTLVFVFFFCYFNYINSILFLFA